ncbi:MAG: hypothetical protein QMD92_07655 [bacterium]|nr:hypothetical protein [bacterium]
MRLRWVYFIFIFMIIIISGCGKGNYIYDNEKNIPNAIIKIKEIKFGLGYSMGNLVGEKDRFTVAELEKNSSPTNGEGGKNEIHYLIYLEEPVSKDTEFLKIWSRVNENGRSAIFSIKKHYAYRGETLLHGCIRYCGERFPIGDYKLTIPVWDSLSNSKKCFYADLSVTN